MVRKIILIYIYLLTTTIAQQYNFIKYDVKDGLALSQISKLETFSDGRLIITTFGGGFNIYDGQNFKLINSTNGLSNNNVYGLAKQNDDLLWLATEKGLSNYDGQNHRNYNKEDGLPSEMIWSIALGKDNVLWIGTDNGLAKYENGKIETIKDELVSNNAIWSLFSDSKGNLWIGMIDQLINYNYETKKFEKRKEFSSIKTIHSVSEDKNGVIWAGSDYGLYRIIGNEYTIFGLEAGLTNDLIWSTYIDSENKLWIGTDEGVTLFDDGKFIKLGAKQGLTDYKIWSIKEDLEKNIWIGSDEGLYKLTDMSFKIYKEAADKRPIDAWTIIEKSENEYWIGSELQGVISFKNGKFSKVQIGDFNVKGISSLFIDQSQSIWITSEKGIYKYSNNNYSKSTVRFTDVEGAIPHIMQDEKGILRFATYYEGTIEYDGRNFNIIKSNSQETPIIFYHMVDSQKRIWAATSYGLKIVSEDSSYTPIGFEHLSDYSFLNLVEDSYGYVWAGSYEKGLYCFNTLDINNVKFDSVSVEHGLNNVSIMATTFDEDGDLWISTNGGFNRLDVNEFHKTGEKIIHSYNLNDGISGMEGFQNGILNDSKNNIIISTIDGVVFFDPRKIKENIKAPSVRIKNIKIVDREFNEKFVENDEIIRLDENYLELPYDHNNLTINYVGISLTNPSKVQYSYQLSNSEWSEPSLVATAYLPNLAYGKHTFKVKAANNDGVWSKEYATINFELIAPFWEKLWFQSLMAIVFLGLIVFFYLYRLRRMNQVNKDLEERIEEKIRYERQLVKSEKELRAAKEKAENSDKLKSEFLAQMSHEIRTPINSILSYTSLLKEDVEDKVDESLNDGFSVIENSSHRLIRTIDSILNMSQLKTGSFELNKKKINISGILRDLNGEFKNIVSQKNLKLELSIFSEDCHVEADQYTITQMFANLIDNAIKYTKRGKIEIKHSKTSSNNIIVEISDTGIGMSEEFQKKIFEPFTQEEQGYTRKYDGSGLGLSLVQKYANLNDVELSYKSKKDFGTSFKVEFKN